MDDSGTANVGSIDKASAYQQSFGMLEDKSVYMNGWQTDAEGKCFDYRGELKSTMEAGIKSIQVKALGPTTGGAGTAGYALVPIYVDPRIVDTSRKQTPLVEMIPRVTNLGLTADYNTMTAKCGGFTAGLDAPMTEKDDTYDRSSVAIKFLYAVGRVLGPMQVGMPSYMMEGFQPNGGAVTSFSPVGAPNAKQLEVLAKARSMKELEEELILNGDASTDATQFSGIVKLQGTTNQLDKSSAALSYSDVETAVRYAYDDGGMPKLAVCSSSVLTDLRAIMLDQFRFTPAEMAAGNTLPFGIATTLVLQTIVGPIPVIPSRFLSNTTGAKQIFFLDTDYIEMRVLQDMTYEDIGKINDSNKFMLKIYECLIMRATQFNSFIDNIA